MMIKALLFDFARTLIFPIDKNYLGGINDLHKKLKSEPDFVFFDHFELNGEVMDYLETIKDKMPLYMFTSETIQDDPAVKDTVYGLFKKVYSAKKMNRDKKDPETYKYVAQDLKLNPSEILFIDDAVGNIEAANKAGMETIRYTDASVIQEIVRVVPMERSK